MLKLLPFLEGLNILFLVVSLFYSALSVLPSYHVLSYHLFLAQSSGFLLLKAAGEAFSYAYHVEVNGAFDPNAYSDEVNEQWDVPPFFSYPPGGTTATCASVDGKMGCVVWNLDGGTSSDPCPTVKAYSPNPDPSTLIFPDTATLEVGTSTYLSTILSDLSAKLARRQVSLTASITPGVLTSGGGYSLLVDMSFSLSSPYITYSKTLNNVEWVMGVSLKGVSGRARCVCDFGGGEVDVATYEVNRLVLGLTGEVKGNRLLEENEVMLIYFTRRLSNNPRANPLYCRMVVE